MVREILVDPKSYELAEHFLADDYRVSSQQHEKRVMSLAQAIQQAVEDWCENESEDHREKSDDDGREYADPRDFREGRE